MKQINIKPYDHQKDPKMAKRKVFGLREIIIVGIALIILSFAPSSGQFLWAQSKTIRLTEANLGEAEKASDNFPGSAFYFLEGNDAIPDRDQPFEEGNSHGGFNTDSFNADSDRLVIGEGNPEGTASPSDDIKNAYNGGPVKPFTISRRSIAYSRALKCLTDAIYYEAATEPLVGQRAVAQVIINRLRHPTYPTSICGVIYQGSERRTGCQFSYSCDGSFKRKPSKFYWNRARKTASEALAGHVFKPVGTATHYHTTEVSPYWAPSLNFIGTIGAHRFYRWKGSAGKSKAFFKRYAGREPFPGPKPRAYSPKPDTMLDPIELQKQFEREYREASLKAQKEAVEKALAQQVKAVQAPYAPSNPLASITPDKQLPARQFQAPDYSNEAEKAGGEKRFGGSNLPSAGNVKSEYQNSGTWKTRPGA